MKKNQEKLSFTFNGKKYTVKNNSLMYYLLRLKPIFKFALIFIIIALLCLKMINDTNAMNEKINECINQGNTEKVCLQQNGSIDH